MHELSIALSMIEGVIEEARKQGDVRVEVVHLKLGAFSGVDEDALQFSYGIACEGTLLEGSRLVIEPVPILIFCAKCEKERKLASVQQLCCPECLTPADQILQGRDLEVTTLEVTC